MIHNSPLQLSIEEIIDKFHNITVKVYKEKTFLTKGVLKINEMRRLRFLKEGFQTLDLPESNSLTIKISNLELNDIDNPDNIYCVIKDELEDCFELEVSNLLFEKNSSVLTTHIDLIQINVLKVNELKYIDYCNSDFIFDWSNIKIPSNCMGKDRANEADAFESLCRDMILKWGASSFEGIGKGADGGKDGVFDITVASWIPQITRQPDKWILQCKYSKNYDNMKRTEVYDEMVKVITYNPDYYLIMTNRKITDQFQQWFNNISQGRVVTIPFKSILINREQMESYLRDPSMIEIRNKYF